MQTVEKKTEGINLEFKKPKLRDIAESIKQHYTVKNVSNMFYVSLVEFLQRALYVHILNKGKKKKTFKFNFNFRRNKRFD